MRDDLRTALRSLRTTPTFTAVALIVLALGIGAGTAIFSVVDAVVLRGLPFDEHDRLVAVLEHGTHGGQMFGGPTTAQTYLDWRAQQQTFDGLAAVSTTSFGLRDREGHPQTVRGLRVTSELFSVLRVAPLAGRTFTAAEETSGRHRLAILSYGFWQRQFAGSRDVIGSTVALNDEPWEVVGVLPRGFAYPVSSATPTDLYVPPAFENEDRVRGDNHNYSYTVIGRLKPGVSIAQAADRMNSLSAALDAQYPTWSPGIRVRVVTLHEHLVGTVTSWMIMLLGAVGLVLLIACANVANLMLARATVRGPEIAIRAALGASRAAIVRGLLVEAVVLSLSGSAIGIGLAWSGVHAILPWLPAGLPRVAGIAIDLRVLVAAIAAAVLTGLAFGLAPAIQSSRPNLSTALKDGGRSATGASGRHHLRSALVVSEVALAVVLVVGAGLFAASFTKLVKVEPGFDYHHVLAVQVGVRWQPGNADETNRKGEAYTLSMLEAVRRVPGVQATAAIAGPLPLDGNWSNTSITLPGRGELTGEGESMERRIVTPGYLELLRVPLLRGRYLRDDDRSGTQRVIVVNQAAARRYWPDQDALGQRLTLDEEERVVVGVVGNIRAFGPEAPPRQEGYVPLAQSEVSGATLVMRTTGDPLTLLPTVKAAIWSVSKDQRISGDIFTLDGYMDRLIAQRRFLMALLALFGVLGLAISAVGIYGVMAYLVTQRTSEIGVRMALGASPGAVMTMVMRRAGWLVALGLAIGTSVAWWSSLAVKRFLFQVEATDPWVFAGALLTLALAGLAASVVPALRATAVDPVIALRQP
jgi:putative ABC transport system permease protein